MTQTIFRSKKKDPWLKNYSSKKKGTVEVQEKTHSNRTEEQQYSLNFIQKK